jgi:hypothetical protein
MVVPAAQLGKDAEYNLSTAFCSLVARGMQTSSFVGDACQQQLTIGSLNVGVACQGCGRQCGPAAWEVAHGIADLACHVKR